MYKELITKLINKAIADAPNEDIKKQLLSLIPQNNVFSRMFKKDISKSEYNTILNSIINVILPFVLSKYPYYDYIDLQNYRIQRELITEIERYYNFHYSIELHDRYYKIYPIDLNLTESKKLYSQTLREIIKAHLETNEPYETLFTKILTEYKRKNEQNKQYLLKNEMKPYYGTPDFMFQRANYIVTCAQKIIGRDPNLDTIIASMEKFCEAYPPNNDRTHSIKKYCYLDSDFKKDYQQFEQLYLSMLEIEKKLSIYSSQIWQNYLTNPQKHNDTNFKYLIHTFSGNPVSPNEINKACCSLVTENLLTSPYGNWGLIFEYDNEAIETICCEDAGSWPTTKEKFVENHLPKNWQLPTPEKQNIFYEYPYISKLILPQDLEKIAIANNIGYNGELLNYQRYCGYSEIVLNKKAKVIGVFYTDNTPNINEVIVYAQKYNLPVVYLSLNKLRTNANLPTNSLENNSIKRT